MFEEQRLKTVVQVIESYRFQKPLSVFLREMFRFQRSMGSRDRKIISQCVYGFFRLGKSIPSLPIPERIAIGLFLTTENPGDFYLWCIEKHSSLNAVTTVENIKEKIIQVKNSYPAFSENNIFPFSEFLSPELNAEEFSLSFLRKPKTWIRVRKKNRRDVLNELKQKNIPYTVEEGTDAVKIQSTFRLEDFQTFSKGYFEVQDLSSQHTGNYFTPKPNESWWDACSGSGGKSLLLFEKESSVMLTATDTREKILFNLKERFKRAGIKNYKTEILNLETESLSTDEMFDGIIVDAPCTGTGTWARSPEWLSFFNPDSVNEYSEKQKKIVGNVIKNLKINSPLVYITCSVFKSENEDNIKYFSENFNLSLESSAYIKGYDKGADTLFVARMIN
ncbi:MAG TPA: RsmB/NOP family class I SAM-dependent RNA methyltransferase [Bacteroidia bacterium]|nr:RsmB/NOP family class I SAM-dependent RNA methyltransferase [Bacteroidia bacterium]